MFRSIVSGIFSSTRTVLSLLLLAGFSITVVYATPPGSPYTPGETLDPSCAPGDTNCTVDIGSSQWTTTGSDIYYDTGNVGIGTTNPTTDLYIYKSSVNGSTKAQINLEAYSTAQSDSSTASFYVTRSGGLAIDVDGSNENISFLNAGNIGIGTNTPSQKLALQSDDTVMASFYNSSNIGVYIGNNGADKFGLFDYSSDHNIISYDVNTDTFDIGSTTGIPVITIDGSTANVGIGTTTPDTQLHLYNTSGFGSTPAEIKLQAHGSVPGDSSSGVLSVTRSGGLSISSTGATTSISLNPSAGSVGIGTSSPSSKLDITTTSLGTTQTTTSGLALVNSTAAAAGAQQISPATRWSGNGWKTNATAASQAVDFRAYVLPVQGSANPTGRWLLESSINGGAYSERFGIGNSGQIFIGGSAGSSGQALLSAGSSSSATWTSLAAIATSGLSNGSGTTAIGTAVYLGGNLLDNVSLNYNGSYDFVYQGNKSGISILAGDNRTQIGDVAVSGGGDIFTVDGGSSYAYYDNTAHTGLFGINTATPTATLDVLGTALFTVTDAPSNGFVVYNSDDGANLFRLSPADGLIIFDEGSNNYKLGIGMNNPSVALDVTGDIEYTGDITDVSDERLKEHITDFEGGLSIINAVGVKNYNMIATPDKSETGFIAQNIKEIFPQAVSIVDPEHGYMGVSYVSFIPVLTKAVQEIDLKMVGINDLSVENDWRDALLAWFANAGNRITRIFTGEICLTDSDGTSECINKSELTQLKQLLATPPDDDGDDEVPPPPSEEEDTDEESTDGGTPPGDNEGEEQQQDEPTEQPPQEELPTDQ